MIRCTSIHNLNIKFSHVDSLELTQNGKDEKFIETTIEGGLNFNSTERYIEQVRNIV